MKIVKCLQEDLNTPRDPLFINTTYQLKDIIMASCPPTIGPVTREGKTDKRKWTIQYTLSFSIRNQTDREGNRTCLLHESLKKWYGYSSFISKIIEILVFRSTLEIHVHVFSIDFNRCLSYRYMKV